MGTSPGSDSWGWQIGFQGLLGQHWIEGTAPNREIAEESWKAAWPFICAMLTEEDWQLGWEYFELSGPDQPRALIEEGGNWKAVLECDRS